MHRLLRFGTSLVALLVLAHPLAAQVRGVLFTPLFGYVWGGGFTTDVADGISAGKLEVSSSFAWGGEFGFQPHPGTMIELTYLRQDSDIRFRAASGGFESEPFSFATNYLHIGGRYELGVNPRIKPFIGGGLGLTIFDVKVPSFGSSTDFSISLHGGVRAMLGEEQRFGILARVRGWFSFVPSGDINAWCGAWDCYVTEGTSTVSQAEVSAGLVIAF